MIRELVTALGTAVVVATTFSIPAYAQQETPIPRSVPGDKGKYFLISLVKSGDIRKVVHKRVGLDSVGYTKTETNCKTMMMREMGYSEVSASKIADSPTKWFELVPGSSKSDLASFVCSK